MEVYPTDFDDAKEYEGLKINFVMYVEDCKYVKMKRHSVELTEYKGGEYEEFRGSNILAIEREPGFFSMHDKAEQSNCLAVDDEWTGQQSNSVRDEINNLVVTQKYNGSSSQLWRWLFESLKLQLNFI